METINFSDYFHFEHMYTANTIQLIDQLSTNNKTVTLDDQNRITSYTDWAGQSFSIEYEGNNMKRFTPTVGAVLEYTYDTKRNPFKPEYTNKLAPIFNLLYVTPEHFEGYLTYRRFAVYLTFLNENNVIGIKETSPSGEIDEYFYTYDYNSDGYPLKKTIIDSEAEVDFIYE